ncbi:TonB-dependent receptor, partial [Pseudomonas sp. SIMBA_068]
RDINSDFKTHVEDENQGLSAQLDWQLGDYTLTSISAWRGWDNTQYQDGDRRALLPLTASHDKGTVDYEQYSQEFRLTSPKGQFNEYVL